jgi:hypothetical protein
MVGAFASWCSAPASAVPVLVSSWRRDPWDWQGRLDSRLPRNLAAVIGHGMSSSIRHPCRPGSRRNVDSAYRLAPLPRDHPGVCQFGHGSRVVKGRLGSLKPCGAGWSRHQGWARAVAAPGAPLTPNGQGNSIRMPLSLTSCSTCLRKASTNRAA